jgi:glycine/D-amino acid oxidase-like deaminating enzyme
MIPPKIAVIGGGVFGSLTAVAFAESGFEVSLFEKNRELLQGASYNTTARLHFGFHYPQDQQTVDECKLGFFKFKRRYANCILDNFPNAYFIAAEGSRTSAGIYIDFCDRNKLRSKKIDIRTFRPEVRNVAAGLVTPEPVYDARLLKESIERELARGQVTVRCNERVVTIEKERQGFLLLTQNKERHSFGAVVNCAYADINRLTQQLGYCVEERQYEYTAVAIVELDWDSPTGITILDGKFMTILPFGRTGKYVLYHVEHSVIERRDQALLPKSWLSKDTAPFSKRDQRDWFHEFLIPSCTKFVPDLRRAKLCGILEGPRMVLRNCEDTDARPSIVKVHGPGYATVFSGKIDHSIWVANVVKEKLLPSLAREGGRDIGLALAAELNGHPDPL